MNDKTCTTMSSCWMFVKSKRISRTRFFSSSLRWHAKRVDFQPIIRIWNSFLPTFSLSLPVALLFLQQQRVENNSLPFLSAHLTHVAIFLCLFFFSILFVVSGFSFKNTLTLHSVLFILLIAARSRGVFFVLLIWFSSLSLHFESISLDHLPHFSFNTARFFICCFFWSLWSLGSFKLIRNCFEYDAVFVVMAIALAWHSAQK